MITLSTSLAVDGGFGGPSSSNGCGADASDFSSVLAGASSAPITGGYTPAVELPSAPATVPPAISEARTVAGLPGKVRADLFSGVGPDAADVAGQPAVTTSSGSSSTPEEPASNHPPADGLVTINEVSAASQQIVQLTNGNSGAGTSGEHSGHTPVPAIAAAAATATRSVMLALTKRTSTAGPSAGSGKTKKDDEGDSGPSSVPIQQVLAAAASLTRFMVSPPVPRQVKQQGGEGPAIAIDPRLAPSLPQDQTSADLAANSQDHKLAGSVVHALSILPSQDPATIVGQQGPAVAHIERVMTASAMMPSPAQALETAAKSQSADLHQLDALVREIAEVSGNTGRATLRLTADQLGPLEIRLHRSDAGMNVSIRTDSEQSHAAVAQAQQQLSDDMRANGLKVAATSVTLGHGGADRDQRDRQHFTFAPPIEAATASSKQSESEHDQQPTGRFA